MKWVGYQDIANALSKGAVPRGKIYDSEHSTPDVYGRAIQQYISLWEARQIGDDTGDTVRTWRGFLTLLALRDHLELPLYWTRVDLTGDMQERNLFYMALEHPVDRKDRLLYPGAPEWSWDGRVFYALQWAPAKAVPEDILLYSPFTLVYPVAGWREKLEKIVSVGSREGRTLGRFFDGTRFRILTGDGVLNKGEPEMVYYFLDQILRSFNTPAAMHGDSPNETQSTVSGHISNYMNDLKRDLRVVPGGAFRLIPFPPAAYTPVQAGWIPDTLQSAVRIGPGRNTGRYFADQICFFKTKDNVYPFKDRKYEDRYRIGNAPSGEAWFAFLPIHPDQRATCVENGLAKSVKMTYSGAAGSGKNPGTEKIDAFMTLPTGQVIGHTYTVSHEPTMQQDMAVCLNGTENALIQSFWPMMSIWPKRIGSDWSEYYVLWDNADITEDPVKLEVANIRNLVKAPAAADDDEQEDTRDTAVMKTNPFVVKTNYVPDAVPLVKRDRNDQVSVGMVMPDTVPDYNGRRTIVANVAVDFGTSSTRVFASIDGDPPAEIEVMGEGSEPQEVIQYKSVGTKMGAITQNFVKPIPDRGGRNEEQRSEEELRKAVQERKERQKRIGDREEIRKRIQERAERTLFSVFRKSDPTLEMEDVAPLLDGNIYQPTNMETAQDNAGRLVSNLKWDLTGKGKYYIAFMKQLLLQITVILNSQGVGQVNWRYSLPRSMSEQGKKAMRRIWTEDMGDFLYQTSGRTLSHDIADEEVTESVAASRYFLTKYPAMLNKGRGFLVVDIGGGSTDAALWQTKNGNLSMVWQDSVKVAGQKMCTQWVETQIFRIRDAMKTNTEEHRVEFAELVQAIPPKNQSRYDETRIALIDRLLTYYSDEMITSFRSECVDKSNSWGMKLYSRIAQGPSLMMFCLGCQVGVLHAAGRFAIKDEEGYFTIALGGRGAGMLDWLERLDWLPYSHEKAERTLARFFCRGMELGETLMIQPQGDAETANGLSEDVVRVIRNTEDPKCEVAYGLLVTELGGEQDATREPGSTTGLRKDYAKSVAKEFRSEFRDVFQSDAEGAQVDMPEIDPHMLATLVQRKTPSYGANMNDMFRILMEAGYEHSEEVSEAIR